MQKIKSGVRYALTIGIAVLLLWFSLSGLHTEGENKFDYLWKAWLRCDKMYLWLMAIAAVLSHIIRAMRWKMLLKPTGHNVSTSNSFWALMTGYLVNLAVPRGGEISRCYTLYQLEKTPIETSFGTVVTERIADVFCLIVLIAFSFYLEWEKLHFVLKDWFILSGNLSVPWWVWIAVGCGVLFMAGIYFLSRNEKVLKIISGFQNGLLSVFRLKQKWLFVLYSFQIWALYFLMSYLVLMAFPETNHLGFSALVTLFAVGTIAMAAPLPGGTGSYHVLVPLVLTTLYSIRQPDAIVFVFVFHAWQTLLVIVVGAISFLVSNTIISNKSRANKT